MSAVTRDREITVRRVGWFVHWEAWLRSPRGHGPVLRGTTWTKRGARHQAAKAGLR